MRSTLTALALALIACAAAAQEPQAPASAPQAAASAPAPVCQPAIDAMKRVNVLYRLRLEGDTPRVLMGPGYIRSDADAKLAAAKVISCYLTGSNANLTTSAPTAPCADFDLLHWQSGATLARFEGCRLKIAQ